jgi:hypothetical protein
MQIQNALTTQFQSLSTNEKKLLDFTRIIIIHPNQFPIATENYNGIVLSDIIISEKLVPDCIDRYYIAHYIRNQIHSGVQKYEPNQRAFRPIADPYYFPNYDFYVSSNAEIICNVIYYFMSQKFYSVYINFHDESFSLFKDKRLGVHVQLLIDKLKKEGLDYPFKEILW